MQLCSQKLLSVACDSVHSGPEHHPHHPPPPLHRHEYGVKLCGQSEGKIYIYIEISFSKLQKNKQTKKIDIIIFVETLRASYGGVLLLRISSQRRVTSVLFISAYFGYNWRHGVLEQPHSTSNMGMPVLFIR